MVHDDNLNSWMSKTKIITKIKGSTHALEKTNKQASG